MVVGGVAVRVTSETWCTGSVRLKHSTAEQFLGHERLRHATEVSSNDPRGLFLHPCPAKGFARPVYAQLRIVPTMAPQSHIMDGSPPPPPSLHCELCGLGAWLRGQGAVPGVHWVQLWRGAGGALRLRLCDGKPTALPGEEAQAAAEKQQVIAVATNIIAASQDTGALDAAAAQGAAAKAAAADAAAKLVGPAAQAVADAAAPWKLRAPTCRAPCVPAGAALQVPAKGCQLGATGAGADGVGSAGMLPMGQWRASGGSGPVVSRSAAGRDCGGADRHGLMDAAPPHPLRDRDTGGASHWLLLPQPRTLAPQPLPVPVPQPSPTLLSPPSAPPNMLASEASKPAACAEASAIVRAHGAELETAAGSAVVVAEGEEQQPEKQQQQQQQHQVGGSGADPAHLPSAGILTGRVSNYKIALRAEGAQGLLATSLFQGRGLQSGPDWIMVHVEEAGGSHSRYGAAQQQRNEFAVRLLCTQEAGRVTRWYLSSVAALLKALGAVDGDTVQLQHKSDGRLMIWRARRQLQQRVAGAGPLAVCPTDGIFVGCKDSNRINVRATAVRALWPKLVTRLACGQSAVLEVHAALADAGGGALGPFRVVLKLHTWESKPAAWRLWSCGPLFRALGAQERDAIYMWRSPGDGRLVAGLQPRGGVHGGGEEQQQGKRQGQEQDAEQQQVQGRQGDGRRQQPQRLARQGALHRLYGEYDVQEPAGGEGGKGEHLSDDDEGGDEEWGSGESEEEGQEQGPPGQPGDGLLRPSKRARVIQGPAQQYGGPSAAQQQMQVTACPAGSVLVGYKYRTQVDVRVGAVSSLWPELASQLACGQSTEVEVHPAVAGAGGEALGPLTVTLQCNSWPSRPIAWRLSGCGQLFQALGAQDGDAIHMWRSPEDGRVTAGLQPRGGVRREGEEVRLGQQQGQEQGAEHQQVQGRRGDERRQQPLRRARQGGLRRLYGDYVVQGPAGGEGGDEEETDYTDEGVEELEIGDAGQVERSSGGLSARQRQRVQLNACPSGSIFVGYMDRTKMDARAAAVHGLWPEAAAQLACGQSTEVEVHPAVADAGGQALGPFRLMLKLNTWPSRPAIWRLTGCGPLFRALGAQDGDAIYMWSSPAGDGRLMVGGHRRDRARSRREKVRLGQGQEGGQEHGRQGDVRSLQLQRGVPYGAGHRLYGDNVVQEALGGEGGVGDEGIDDDEDAEERGRGDEGRGGMWSGPQGDGFSRPSKRARAAEGPAQQYGGASAAQQQQQQQPMACPAGSILVGFKHCTQVDVRVAAVRALWPDLAGQLACGQGMELEVHPAVVEAGAEASGPFRVVLKLHTWKGRTPTWRLSSCGPLFRAMGAQERDAVFMWRSPGDGRLMAGVQPRGGACGGGGYVQIAGPGRAGKKVRQVYDEYDVHETTDEGEEELEDEEETEEGRGGYWEEEEEVEGGQEVDEEGFGGEASVGSGWAGVGQGCGVMGGGGGWGWDKEGLECGGGTEAGVGGEEEGEEEDEPGVNWWAREARWELGFGEDDDAGEQEDGQV